MIYQRRNYKFIVIKVDLYVSYLFKITINKMICLLSIPSKQHMHWYRNKQSSFHLYITMHFVYFDSIYTCPYADKTAIAKRDPNIAANVRWTNWKANKYRNVIISLNPKQFWKHALSFKNYLSYYI